MLKYLLFLIALKTFDTLGQDYNRTFNKADSLAKVSEFNRAVEELELIANRDGYDLVIYAQAFYKIGRLFDKQKEDAIALKYYLKSLDINEKLKDTKNEAKVLFRLGVFFADRHQSDKARYYLNKCLIAYALIENGLWISLTKLSLGNVEYEDENYLRAISIYDSLKNSPYIKNSDMYLGMIANNMANAYKEVNEYNKALDKYQEARKKYEKLNDRDHLIGTYYNIGFLYNLKNQFKQAEYYLDKSLDIGMKNNAINDVKKAYYELAVVYDKTGRFKKAYDTYIIYDSLENELNNIEVTKQITELQTKYETEKKEKEIVTQKAQIQQATTQRNSLFMVLAIAFVLFGVAIIFYVQRNRTVRAVAEKKVEVHRNEINRLLITQETKAFDAMIEGQEKERKRMAEELHDRLGSTLSATKMHFEAVTNGISETGEFDYVNKLLDKAIEDTRQISHNMLSGVLTKFGLVAALKDLKETIIASGQLEVSFETIQFDERLELEKEINLYRIVQELVSNTLRHAMAKKLYIKLEKKGKNLELLVQDDGKGIGDTKNENGIGLRNIESRVRKMNGSWKISSVNQGGTEAIVSISV